jgi:hypothetical protein
VGDKSAAARNNELDKRDGIGRKPDVEGVGATEDEVAKRASIVSISTGTTPWKMRSGKTGPHSSPPLREEAGTCGRAYAA